MFAKSVVVIGGGPAGMMAASTASENGKKVVLVEQNKILGKKLLITGKGRCNITSACDDCETLIKNVPTNGSFLYSAFYTFTNEQTIKFFNDLGVETKIERGHRVFPVSDKSMDVKCAMEKHIIECGVKIIHDRVDDIAAENGRVTGVVTTNNGKISADSIILATGGMSYQKTGSTGDGYTWAENLGHTITEIYPSLVPLETDCEWAKNLAGLSLRNVGLRIKNSKGKSIYKDFGEMMFAHFGLTGPIILSASAHMRNRNEKYTAVIDLKPALDEKKLDLRIQRDFQKYSNKAFKNSLFELLPSRIAETVTLLSKIDPDKKVNSITRAERLGLVELIKNMEVEISGFCPIEQAIITSGGVCVKEINPSTMESKLVNGLYFAGEIIDVDAYTGGFNLQIAFSTGFLAGLSC